jgi:hypothetical protein
MYHGLRLFIVGVLAEVSQRTDVRRADSLPEERAIDCEKAARWVKAKGARRVAKARMADIVDGCCYWGVCGVARS